MRRKKHGETMNNNGGAVAALKSKSVEGTGESEKSGVVRKISWMAAAAAAAQLTLDVIRVIRGLDDFRRKVKPE
ncbi:MAG: hypothetical protein JXA49_05910 [Actinobacteria bacterium]|nr:hypothetical protein [Actinomycetota bacterium]